MARESYSIRLADRIASGQADCFPGFEKYVDAISKALQLPIPKIVADEVDIYYERNIKPDNYNDSAINIKDIPNAAPPFPMFWVESRNSDKEVVDMNKYGCFCICHDFKDQFGSTPASLLDKQFPDETRWVVICHTFAETTKKVRNKIFNAKKPIFYYPIVNVICVDDHGKVIQNIVGDDSGATESLFGEQTLDIVKELAPMQTTMVLICMLAISFFHCRNLKHKTIGPPKGLLKRANKTKEKFFKYKVLDIYPMKEVLESEGNASSDGIKKALHKCRGHWRVVSKPFGKDVDIPQTWWIREHKRGDKEIGEIQKDYRMSFDV